jgi:hypothetical protein
MRPVVETNFALSPECVKLTLPSLARRWRSSLPELESHRGRDIESAMTVDRRFCGQSPWT